MSSCFEELGGSAIKITTGWPRLGQFPDLPDSQLSELNQRDRPIYQSHDPDRSIAAWAM